MRERLRIGEVAGLVSVTTKTVKLAEDHLGDLLEDVSPSLLEQEKRLWSTIESLEWPAPYMEDFIGTYPPGSRRAEATRHRTARAHRR